MIHYRLVCKDEHEFQAWFRDSEACDVQLRGRHVSCPDCGSTEVQKALMAPAVAKPRDENAEAKKRAETMAVMMQQLRQVRRKVEENCEYVGERFAEEARRIHYGEVDPKGIYGETSPDEAEALKDEGIEFGRIPWVPLHDS